MIVDDSKTVSISKAATILGTGVTPENVRGRILRGTLEAHKNNKGDWRVLVADLERILEEIGSCEKCDKPATSKIIVKHHFHEYIEFVLCDECACVAESAYNRKRGVLEIVSYPLLGEGWFR